MIEVENTDVNIVRNLMPMRNHMPASAYGLKAISDCLHNNLHLGSSFMIFALPFSENPIILFHFQAEKSHQTPKILFFALSISWEFPM